MHVGQGRVRIKIRLGRLPWQSSGEESALQSRGHEFDPWLGQVGHVPPPLSLHAAAEGPTRGNKQKYFKKLGLASGCRLKGDIEGYQIG